MRKIFISSIFHVTSSGHFKFKFHFHCFLRSIISQFSLNASCPVFGFQLFQYFNLFSITAFCNSPKIGFIMIQVVIENGVVGFGQELATIILIMTLTGGSILKVDI